MLEKGVLRHQHPVAASELVTLDECVYLEKGVPVCFLDICMISWSAGCSMSCQLQSGDFQCLVGGINMCGQFVLLFLPQCC
jgi:hypothetical protein